MTRSEIIYKVYQANPGITLSQAENCVAAILDQIADTLRKRDRVELRGFGVFSVRHREGRVGRNPRTGSQVKIPSKNVPFFKAGKLLKERMNKK